MIENTTVKCRNGRFIGCFEDNGVLSFKGIPYAKAPVGELRWKAPRPALPSDDIFNADTFGCTSIQYKTHSEKASYHKISEDCLYLNVWTKNVDVKKKPVMFFIHGGGFAWGGSADPLYNGKFLVGENEDIVIVTCNYRVGLMGFVDFSDVDGGEDFPDAPYLGVLDLIEGLRWVRENIEGFGGDPDNITIFGESAGGALVSVLMVAEKAAGLFHKAIAQSGCLNLTYTREDYAVRGLASALLEATGARNMSELMAMDEQELIKAYISKDEEGCSLNDIFNMPLREGSLIPEDPFEALALGASKDVPFMIGSTKDEWRYWIGEMSDISLNQLTKEEQKECISMYGKLIAQEKYDDAVQCAVGNEKEILQKFLDIVNEDDIVWKYTELGNENVFRIPAITAASNHAKAGGKTYMYYFCKECDNPSIVKAGHASELAYVFNNIYETDFSGTVDKGLAKRISKAWTDFARNGNPGWEEYDCDSRKTMVIGKDNSMKVVKDPLREQRLLLQPFVKYYLK